MTPRQGYRRGYPVAILAGIEEDQAVLWKVFSNVVKPDKTLNLNGHRNDTKALYNFHETIINALRPTMKEGVRSIIIASPARSGYADKFFEHVKSHHAWLIQGQNKAIFSVLPGSATTIAQVTILTRQPEFRKKISEATTEETENLIDILEKRLSATTSEPIVLYSMEEIENQILSSWKPGKPKPEYLIITDAYLSASRQKNRLQRLMQVATNRQVKTRIVQADSPAGKRLTQLGGLVCLQRLDQ